LSAGVAAFKIRIVEGPAIHSVDCPALPSSEVTVYARTLHRACEVLGGMEPLSRQLGVSPSVLTLWIEGRQDPPLHVFLAAVDIVLLAAERGGGTG
jgi:hypothetical protein